MALSLLAAPAADAAVADSATKASPGGVTTRAGGYQIANTNCRISASDPHISTTATTRAVRAKGGIACTTAKRRIWVEAQLQRRRPTINVWTTVDTDEYNKDTGQPKSNLRATQRSCANRAVYIYRLRIEGTVVTLDGMQYKNRVSYSNERQIDCGF